MERNRRGSREHRGDKECGEFQHGDHDLPPLLRLGELQSHGQFQFVDKKELTEKLRQLSCVGDYTPWPLSRTKGPTRLAQAAIRGSVERLDHRGGLRKKWPHDRD